MKKPQLVLDAAGVIVTNLSPSFWQEEVAAAANIPYEDVKALFKKEMRLRLWNGEVSLDDFWSWLFNHFPVLDQVHMKTCMDRHLVALPALELIPQWSALADIHILSNHRAEWLTPLLEPVANNLKSVTISSEAGCCKPESRIYHLVRNHFEDTTAKIIYVDDQEKNLVEPKRMGWHTIIADEDGRWISEVGKLLNE
ncbi:hypothetical protein [Paenibacillus sp. RC67]|uniref:HAD family hydrolase n=1 Tax=Paenibacillus sp. RC67 TaxID=3039392 RepID=UPI0024AE856C|nr:hypothetical protein [Paenibacillus sp. RC67]